MVHRGDVVDNPITGERITFLDTSRDTSGELLRIAWSLKPDGFLPGAHIHPHQEERFEVVSGTLGLCVGGREQVLSPGQSAVGPPGVPHKWWNPSDEEEVYFLVGLRPGLGVETLLETVLGLARDGKTVGLVPKNPLQLAVLVREAGSWGYVTGMPRQVQNALFAPVTLLAFFGGLLDYRASYPKYSGLKATGPNEQGND